MNPISLEFAVELNASPWMGSVYEAGFGIPFQYNYLNIPGASRTILLTECRYNKAFQPVLPNGRGGFQRSVSHQMVEAISNEKLDYLFDTIEDDIFSDHAGGSGLKEMPPLFSLTVSGAQSGSSSRGASHGWVNLSVAIPDQPVRNFAFHFFNHKQNRTWVEDEEWFPVAYDTGMPPEGHWEYSDVTREEAGAELVRLIQWFMEKILLKKYESWNDAIDAMPKSKIMRVDVIRADDISIEEHLKLARQDTPLVYHDGEFKRPVDYLRRYDRIYRGSFNPITETHHTIGEGALFEISLNNIRKAASPLNDIAGRLEEVSLCDHPVLVTDGMPAFVSLDHLLTERGGKNFQYIVGMDTFNAIVADKYNPTKHYLGQFYGEGSSFIVVPREDMVLTDNYRTASVEWEFYTGDYDPTISSSRVRNGEINLVPEPARFYAAERLGLNG